MDPLFSLIAGAIILPFGAWSATKLIQHDTELAAHKTLLVEMKEDLKDIKVGQDAIITHLLNRKVDDARR